MSGPAPAASAHESDFLRRMTDRLRFWTGAPRLGLLLFMVVDSPPTVQAAVPDAPTNFEIAQESTITALNFQQFTMSWTAPSGTITAYEYSLDDGAAWRSLTSTGSSIILPGSSYSMLPGKIYNQKTVAHNTDGLSLMNGDEFGSSVAIAPDGASIFVGADGDDTGTRISTRGAVYMMPMPAGGFQRHHQRDHRHHHLQGGPEK